MEETYVFICGEVGKENEVSEQQNGILFRRKF
jgi:hypothetical protein